MVEPVATSDVSNVAFEARDMNAFGVVNCDRRRKTRLKLEGPTVFKRLNLALKDLPLLISILEGRISVLGCCKSKFEFGNWDLWYLCWE
jgi:hypothetical protein